MPRQSSKVTLRCPECETEFKIIPYRIAKAKRNYCSRDCKLRGMAQLAAAGHFARAPLIDRFFRFVGGKQPNGCILWMGATDKDGYGAFDNTKAHRVAYDLFVGGLDPELLVCHSCDNPPCINPVHLFQGTELDNAEDMVSKGRSHGGSDHWSAKLTEEQVREIKSELASPSRNRRTRRALAKRFNVTPAIIYQIDWGRIWKHV